jgi:signal transduction histidine kinase
LVEITRTLVAAHTPETLVRLIAEKARLIMGARLCTLRLVNAETGELELESLAGAGRSPKSAFTKKLTLGERVARQVIAEGKPIYIGDMTQAEGYVPLPPQVTDSSGDGPAPTLGRGVLMGAGPSGEQGRVRTRQGPPLRSLLAAPLRVGKQSIGVLAVYSATPNRYGDNEARVFSLLANYAATAIENAQLYQSLRAQHHKIIHAQEEVHRELARDLHDGTAQFLATIALKTEYIQGLLDTDRDKARQELENLGTTARQAMKDVRSLIFRLRPVILETRGLIPALETYLGQVRREDGPALCLQVNGLPLPLSTQQEGIVFSIVQEAVNNSLKHSQAQHVWLRLEKQGRSVQITVEDDGCGFDVAAVERGYAQNIRLGLLTMRERAELIDGLLTIESTPGKGNTRVILNVPAQPKRHQQSPKGDG